MRTKPTRAQLLDELRARDGDDCQHPDCSKVLDFSLTDGPDMPTIEHWMPQSRAREMGWTEDQIWDLDNLKIFCRKCNAKKGDLIPNEDGTLPEKRSRKFRYRRDKRAQRPEVCTACTAGRDLGPDEVCASCGSGPMPERFPRWAKVRSSECDHSLFWCWSCSIGIVERTGATEMIMFGGEGGED